MALRITYETDYGINCPEAHCVISRTECFKKETFRMTYNGEIYYNEQSYLDGKTPIAGFNMEYELDINDDTNRYNIVKECYEHLKTVAGFDNSVDC
mgnify:CR=1 FL=1|jgi:hypothetical protein|tara:strand:- start:60 stop:347 length:288 start_codon:yes stop_codon:yes gene_type:complete